MHGYGFIGVVVLLVVLLLLTLVLIVETFVRHWGTTWHVWCLSDFNKLKLAWRIVFAHGEHFVTLHMMEANDNFQHLNTVGKKKKIGKDFFYWSIWGLEILVSLRGNFILSKLLSSCANNSFLCVYYFLNKIIESELDIISALHLGHKVIDIDGRIKNKMFCKV